MSDYEEFVLVDHDVRQEIDTTQEETEPALSEHASKYTSKEDNDSNERYVKDPCREPEDYDDYDRRFWEISNFILNLVGQATKHQPAEDASREAFDKYWRQSFTFIRDIVTSNPDLPDLIRLPNTAAMDVTVVEHPEIMCCACVLDPCDEKNPLPRFEVAAPPGEGLSKDLFVARLGEALYGTDEGSAREVGDEDERLVVKGIYWMQYGAEDHFSPVYVTVNGSKQKTVADEEEQLTMAYEEDEMTIADLESTVRKKEIVVEPPFIDTGPFEFEEVVVVIGSKGVRLKHRA